jgi:hypothetical protein
MILRIAHSGNTPDVGKQRAIAAAAELQAVIHDVRAPIEQLSAAEFLDGLPVITTLVAVAGQTDFIDIAENSGVDNLVNFDELKYFTGYTQVRTYSTTLSYIGEFEGCINLKSIALDSITNISNRAFHSTGLNTIEAPNLIRMDQSAFENCTSLTEVKNLGRLQTLPSYAFRGCTSLYKVVLPDTLTSISNGAFYGYTALTELTIPSSVTRIGGSNSLITTSAFANSGLTKIYWNIAEDSVPQLPNEPGVFGPNIQVIYVPKGAIERITGYTYWEPYKNLLVEYDFSKH